MSEDVKLVIGVQKSGKLSESTFELLEKCGIKTSKSENQFLVTCKDFPIELYLLRDDDISGFVDHKACDIGIVGKNVLEEYGLYQQNKNGRNDVDEVRNLGFSRCRLSFAIPESVDYEGLGFLHGKKIATSYPHIVKKFLEDNKIRDAKVITIHGSVEISVHVGVADVICDIVSSGATLIANRLKEVCTVLKSEAVLISNKGLSQKKLEILERLLLRIDSVVSARASKYIMLHVPKDKVVEVVKVLPGCENPTLMELRDDSERLALHAVSSEEVFWDVIEDLKRMGCTSILVLPIEKIVL